MNMGRVRRPFTAAVGGCAVVAGVTLATAGAATATPSHPRPEPAGAVYVVNDATSGNRVFAYTRAADGTLQPAGSVATGGTGARLNGAVVDATASQGALTADRRHGTLLAVNAGSNSVSVVSTSGRALSVRQVVGSRGEFPVSVTANGDRVFVLNARGGGSIQGYLDLGGYLLAVPAWHRDLHLPVTTDATEFTHTPGQVAFTPDGRNLVVTTKAATDSILVFPFVAGWWLAATPTVRTEPGAVPFDVAFDAAGRLQVALAGPNAVATYVVGRAGALTPLGTTPTGGRATCWITASGDLLATSNAGSATVTTLRATRTGGPAKIADTPAGAGTVDASFTPDGRHLYVQTGATGGVDAFAVDRDGTLTPVGSVTVPDAAGAEGIVAW